MISIKFETGGPEFSNTTTRALAYLKIKIYRTIILPVVLYGCETWSLTLREEREAEGV